MTLKEEFDIVLAELNLLVSEDEYRGEVKEYIVVNYADERPALEADDEPLMDEVIIQVHHFFKGASTITKKKIRKLIRQADYTVINTEQFFENDTKYTHRVFEVWKEVENTDMEEE